MNPEVKSPVLVTPEAVRTMNEILSRGKGVELAVRMGGWFSGKQPAKEI